MQRVVVVFPGALGDLLLALPALRALRRHHAGAPLTLVVNDWLRPVAALARMADDLVPLDAAASAGLFGGAATPPWLAGRPLVYSFLGGGDEGFRARVTAAATSVRFLRVERGGSGEHAALAYARALGVPLAARALAAEGAVAPPPSDRTTALLAALGGSVLALHPGAGTRAKRWDVAGFVQVAHWWEARGGRVAVLLGPAEAGEPAIPLGTEVREWPLPDLAALLAATALYLGNDSGVSHLAGAVGARGVALFGPTQPRRWRPASRRIVPLHAASSGAQPISLGELPAARVIAACRRRLALTRGTPMTSVRA
jgi:heptosyltransferase III